MKKSKKQYDHGNFFRAYRENVLHQTQAEAAKAAGCSQSLISKLENNAGRPGAVLEYYLQEADRILKEGGPADA